LAIVRREIFFLNANRHFQVPILTPLSVHFGLKSSEVNRCILEVNELLWSLAAWLASDAVYAPVASVTVR